MWSGVAAVVVAFAAILGATLLSPTFSWSTSALSDLGVPGTTTAPLFDGGLLLAGLLGLPFVGWCWTRARNRFEAVGAALLALALVAMALVGVFPLHASDLHLPVAVAFYVLLTYGLFVYGTGNALAGSVRRGLGTLWLGVFHVSSWLLWAAGVRLGAGLAIPETVGALLFAAWVLATTPWERR